MWIPQVVLWDFFFFFSPSRLLRVHTFSIWRASANGSNGLSTLRHTDDGAVLGPVHLRPLCLLLVGGRQCTHLCCGSGRSQRRLCSVVSPPGVPVRVEAWRLQSGWEILDFLLIFLTYLVNETNSPNLHRTGIFCRALRRNDLAEDITQSRCG